MFVSTKAVLDQVLGACEYTLLVPSRYYDVDRPLAQRYGIRVGPFYNGSALFWCAALRRLTGMLIGPAVAKETVRILEESDLILDIRGIIFPGRGVRRSWRRLFGRFLLGFTGGLQETMRFAANKLVNKPVVKYTSSLGPFNFKWAAAFARLYLGRFTDLILARDVRSVQEIEQLGIRTPVVQVPDTAFLLPSRTSPESERCAEIRRQRPLIGLSVSYQVRNRAPASVDYVGIMARFTQHLIDRLGAHVLLIPNERAMGRDDDRQVAEAVFEQVDRARCEIIDTDELLAPELKGIIGECDAVVAARYHTIVASLSLGIPTLAVGWHHKYAGVFELFHQENRVHDVTDLTFDDLVRQFDQLWDQRQSIRRTLLNALPGVQDGVLEGARSVRRYVLGETPGEQPADDLVAAGRGDSGGDGYIRS